jgi:hypothetical protein
MNFRNQIGLLVLFLLLAVNGFSQLERIIVETYYVSDENDATDVFGGGIAPGTTTYRIYADLVPGSTLKAMYGDALHPFHMSSTQPFFNHATDGQSFANNFIRARYEEGTVALDTWLTLGQTARQGPMSFYGILKEQDNNGSFVGGVNNDGGSEGVSSGLLINQTANMGLPLTVADGMDTLSIAPTGWFNSGLLDFVTGNDTTMFGSIEPRTEFFSTSFVLSNSGVQGLVADSNQIIIAQLTTSGELSFLLNLEVEYLENGEVQTTRYVGTNETSGPNEVFNPFLSFPFACGCTDANYLEFDAAAVCNLPGACATPIVLGCTDSLACNFDPLANFSTPNACCYVGWCNERNIEQVCPHLKGESFDFSVFPNPTSDVLTLNVISGFDTYIHYYVYNSYGTLEKENRVEETPLNFVESIPVSDLVPGVYQIKVKTSKGEQYQLFVKL